MTLAPFDDDPGAAGVQQCSQVSAQESLAPMIKMPIRNHTLSRAEWRAPGLSQAECRTVPGNASFWI
jgi:hypothetical protein